MESVPYKVAIHYDEECGQVEYYPETHEIIVVLGHTLKKKAVEDYLSNVQSMPVADGEDLVTFHTRQLKADESIDSFKNVMTRLWHHTGVYVDWSRPVR
jgi:hypothetical protein